MSAPRYNYPKQAHPHRVNSTRKRAYASLMGRHARLETPDGRHMGCLCGNLTASRNRVEYYLHLGELIDMLVNEAVDAALGPVTV